MKKRNILITIFFVSASLFISQFFLPPYSMLILFNRMREDLPLESNWILLTVRDKDYFHSYPRLDLLSLEDARPNLSLKNGRLLVGICNSYDGRYLIENNRVKLQLTVRTLKSCGSALNKSERFTTEFFSAEPITNYKTYTYKIQGRVLTLSDEQNGTSLILIGDNN